VREVLVPYIGRFAPSPTGPLHAGSLVAALASWLDARAHGGQWLVRIEDVDTPRCIPGADQTILQQLATCGLVPDAPVMWQSQRGDAYQAALNALVAKGWAYPCGCSRKEIEDAQAVMGHTRERHQAAVYPGTCRHGLNGKAARAWRLNVQRVIDDLHLATPLTWQDRWLGPQQQNVAEEAGDFVLRRADGLWAYQLAVVVDDAAQGITHIVRGADLTDNTARQIVLQHALGLPTPSYMHTPLVLGENGEKLSKQNCAEALDVSQPLRALQTAGQALGLPKLDNVTSREQALTAWTKAWPPVTCSLPR
jgi:glutamyl-Q tRNA(Asp) synthetase